MAAERERLARQLRDTRMQLAMTQARLSALEQSATMRFGRMVANAAHRPWPRGAQLPRDLYRLWRDRGIPKSGAANAATALASAQLTDLAGTGERFLSALTAPGVLSLADPGLALSGVTGPGGVSGAAGGLVVTGALSALGCATLAPDAVVHPPPPHDADVVLEGTGADPALIEAVPVLPGQPWAYPTDPAAADRAGAGPDGRHGPVPRQACRPAAGRPALPHARSRLARAQLRRGGRRGCRRGARAVQPGRGVRRPANRPAVRRSAGTRERRPPSAPCSTR